MPRQAAATNDDDSDTESIDGVSPEDDEMESPSKTEYLRQKTIEFWGNKYLDRLMSLPGLEEAKAKFLHARAQIKASSWRDTASKMENYDIVFTGNEGTGKSTVAKLYAKFLISEGLFEPAPESKGIYSASSYYFRKTDIIDAVKGISTSEHTGCVSQLFLWSPFQPCDFEALESPPIHF